MPLSRLLTSSAALALVASPAPAFTLHILHMNDTHSRIESISQSGSTCSTEDEAAGECFGGVARLATAVAAKRAELEGENVLFLDAGDQFQGSLFFTTYEGQAELEFMSRLGVDAMVLGNHEFDLGPEPLTAFVEGAEFPVVFGNVDASANNGLAPLDRDPVILEVGGERVGIVGAVAEDTAQISSPGPTIAFGSATDHLNETIAALEADGVEHIIALTHVGVHEDLRLAAEVRGIDAIVGGHSHTLFSNTAEGAAYAYPHMVEGPSGTDVPVVQAGAYTQYLGHLSLTFDDAGVVTAAQGDTMVLDASIERDPDVLARIEEMKAPIAEAMGRVVAEAGAAIDGSRETCRAEECEMGNLVADAMLGRVAGQGISIAIQNGGGLRASIDAGPVTMGEVVSVLPFQNTLATFELSGADVVAALENGLGQVEEGAGRFPQVAGLRYTWDPEADPGARVVSVEVADGEAWVPLDPGATYGVVSNNFMRNGGDGYEMFRDNATNVYDFGPNLEVVVADYLAERTGYEPYLDGRISAAE
jgi:5'-nucleotidase